MPRIGLATAEAFPELDFDDRPLRDAFARAGVDAVPSVWTDAAVDWSAFDLVVVRTTWDYTERRAEFLAWAERVAASVPLWNPPETLRWNSEKGYLRDLESRGEPVVPTVWPAVGAKLDAILAERGWEEVIVKPAVSSGARGLLRARRAQPGAQSHLDSLLAAGDVLVQPFFPSIESEGELSVLCLDGEPSHAVRKLPQRGDIRIQPEYGGTAEAVELDDAVREVVASVLGAVDHPVLYARVDLIRAPDGGWRLIELELVEPRFFLEPVPGSGDRVAAAILARA